MPRVFLGAEQESAVIFYPRPHKYGQKSLIKNISFLWFTPRMSPFQWSKSKNSLGLVFSIPENQKLADLENFLKIRIFLPQGGPKAQFLEKVWILTRKRELRSKKLIGSYSASIYLASK